MTSKTSDSKPADDPIHDPDVRVALAQREGRQEGLAMARADIELRHLALKLAIDHHKSPAAPARPNANTVIMSAEEFHKYLIGPEPAPEPKADPPAPAEPRPEPAADA